MNRKSQTVSEIFVIIVSAIVLIMIILWGSKAIKSFSDRTDDAKFVNFVNSLQSDVEKVAFQRGTIKKVEVSVPGGVSKVCFTEYKKLNDNLVPADVLKSSPKIIVDRARSIDRNVFFIPPSDVNVRLKNLTVYHGILCLNVSDGDIVFRAEGSGRNVCVSAWGDSPSDVLSCN